MDNEAKLIQLPIGLRPILDTIQNWTYDLSFQTPS